MTAILEAFEAHKACAAKLSDAPNSTAYDDLCDTLEDIEDAITSAPSTCIEDLAAKIVAADGAHDARLIEEARGILAGRSAVTAS